jgi:hypothetical protein
VPIWTDSGNDSVIRETTSASERAVPIAMRMCAVLKSPREAGLTLEERGLTEDGLDGLGDDEEDRRALMKVNAQGLFVSSR